MHFMNPVPVMKLVEIIRGIATDEPTFRRSQALAGRLGKTTAVAEDFPAFIVNRILVPMINEAVYALHEGVGTRRRHRHGDEAGRQPPDGAVGAGGFHRPGYVPVDHAGAARGDWDSKYRPCPLLVKYVEAGWLGRKTGRGFYEYGSTPPRPTR